ncbi:MAG: AbrB/MazE/SpoVT family DNA-binding domain-containing protein [Candidatus Desantisbacteria bacterium]
MKVYNKGQVVIPVGLRRRYNINVGEFVEVAPENGGIRLSPIRKERLTDKLFGIFAKYKEGKERLTEKAIESTTEKGFVEGYK